MPALETRVDISPERVTLAFDLTADDVAAYYRAHATTDPAYVRAAANYRANSRAAIVLCTIMALGVGAVVLSAIGEPSVPQNVVLVAIAGTAMAMWSYFMARGYRTALATMHATQTMTAETLRPELRYELGPVSMDLGPEGFVWRTRHHDTHQRWTGVADVRQTDESVHILRLDRWGYLIPKRVFASAEQGEQVVGRLRGWLDALGHTDARRAREWLAKHDARCPQCEYNLRGGDARQCPECGLEFSAEFTAAIGARGRSESPER